MNDDTDLDKLISRVDFYESCVDQLKKELPKYLAKQVEIDKSHKAMAKVLRSVASSEPNQKLQSFIFLYSQKQELFGSERSIYNNCDSSTRALVENSQKLMITPLKDIINDQKNLKKASELEKQQQQQSASQKKMKPPKNDISDAQFIRSTLPIHVKMFEKHRLKSVKQLLGSLLRCELKYHCRVVEELSILAHSLAHIDEDD